MASRNKNTKDIDEAYKVVPQFVSHVAEHNSKKYVGLMVDTS